MTGQTAVIASYVIGVGLLLAYGLRTWLSLRAIRRRRRR